MKARDNPFRVERILTIRFAPQGTDWPALWQRLVHLRYRAAIAGPKGSGKTTLLEDLQPHLRAAGFTVIWVGLGNEDDPLDVARLLRLARAASGGDVILCDGADRLSSRQWRDFVGAAATAGGLIVTSHRPGLLPTLLQTTTSPQLLERIVAQLVNDIGDAAPVPTGELFTRHRGNVRDALRVLYDDWAARDTLTRPTGS